MGGVKRSARNIAWCERHIRLPEGKFVGQPLKMAAFMKEDFRAIYDNPAGTRRAILTRGRKNAKTTECAMILLLHLCGPEHRINSQLYSAAQSRDQAAIIFALAAKMIRMSPELSAAIEIRETAKQLYCPELGTLYRALSADAPTAYGLSPVLVIHDEAGQIRGPKSELYMALETATAAQEAPLSVLISTQAPTDADLLSILIDDALAGNDPRTVVRMQTAPEESDPFDVETIRAANPAFDLFMNRDEVLAMAEDARRMPSLEPEYRNLILNQRVEASSPFITKTVWVQNGDEPANWGAVYGGLDLSETNDLTALVLVSPVKGFLSVRPTFWLPEEGLAERARKDRVPYDVWAKQGFLKTTPGRSVEYEYVANYLAKLFEEMTIRKVAFDRFNMRHLRPWLVKAGLSETFIEDHFVDFGQGFVSMSPALRTLESMLLNTKLRHGNQPVLTMCMANAVVEMDAAGNRKLSKKKSRGRIDGAVALAMACAMSAEDMNERHVFPVSVESILEDATA